jgi:hypothetical protein
MFKAAWLLALLCVVSASPVVVAQKPDDRAMLDAVLRRAGAYVLEFQGKLSGIVAEERYEQNVKPVLQSYAIGGLPRAGAAQDAWRVLKSDLLLVKPVGADRWVQFRDVFEVDGKPVHDRNERLVKLFLEPTAATSRQAEQIVSESSRYNIGNVQRTINVPVLALLILDPTNQRRFQFWRGDDRKPRMGGEPKALDGAGLWVIEYEELRRGTMIRTTNDQDLPSHGRFWIEASTGRVLATELVAEDTALRGTIDVKYQLEPAVNLLVPIEMRERYEIRRDGSRVEGTATYARFRQFQVKVDEKIAPIKER